ncbi:MAG: FMN-binding negative transcriptional regulator [Dermatophilaceae bacterium]
MTTNGGPCCTSSTSLHELDFGQLIAPGGPDRDLPVVVPTHFVFDGEHTLELHLARANPVWRALTERPRALFTVVADYVYVPAAVNADAGEDPALAVPTSYYAAVQAEVDVEIVDDPMAKAAILARALSHFEPEDSQRIAPGVDVESDRRLMLGIRGLRLTITGVNAKLKYGGNKTQEHRADIAAALQTRNGPMDAAARHRLMSRQGPEHALAL